MLVALVPLGLGELPKRVVDAPTKRSIQPLEPRALVFILLNELGRDIPVVELQRPRTDKIVYRGVGLFGLIEDAYF